MLLAPRYMYRYFKTKEQALRFATGQEIRVSTFEDIRAADACRADKNEGVITYKVTKLDGATPLKKAEVIRKSVEKFGLVTDESSVVENCCFIKMISDAYILCLSQDGRNAAMKRIFGEHVVRIENPWEFFLVMSYAMRRKTEILGEIFCRVQYLGRNFEDADETVEHPAMANVKSLNFEKESRMVWFVNGEGGIKPIFLFAPEISRYCKMMEHKR